MRPAAEIFKGMNGEYKVVELAFLAVAVAAVEVLIDFRDLYAKDLSDREVDRHTLRR